ncbi:hypothetical protein [Nocardioides soli]|uniref:Zinc-finger domain-containing protein n=1 Tax=Nocardioides soli TaxID=1036020 RepID=A0A7W4VT41_9ACTN|nr:hypothetical protein [Nocardioides soli]MBB3041290.1 hypothetical protein [Nocardioides soli]
MIGPGHLGPRVSALLDGQLSAEDTERAWTHVHQCHTCRDQVEREGWVKTRLAGLAYGTTAAPLGLKGSLLGALPALPALPGEAYLVEDRDSRRRQLGLVALGGGAVGAAFMGILALGVAPADAPTIDRRAPATITQTRSPQAPTTQSPELLRSGPALHRRQQ